MTPNNRRPRSERAESAVQVLILLAIGGCAAAASFTHVHNVAAVHGQPGWLAWADAVVLELMSIATGLEIRRRHRSKQPAGFVMWILCAAVALSLSAQVAEAERSLIGWIAAALPALGFLACVKIVLTRTPATSIRPAQDGPRARQDEPIPTAAPSTPPASPGADVTSEDRQDDQDAMAVPDLLSQARSAVASHRAATGRDITRDQLRTALRVSTDAATELLRQVRTDRKPSAALVPVPPDAFARVNGTAQSGGAR